MKDLKSSNCLLSGSKAKRERRLQASTKKPTKCEDLSDKLEAAGTKKAKNATKSNTALLEASKKYIDGKCSENKKKKKDRRLQASSSKVDCSK